ncbi:hypothetical protein ACWCXH_07670 [Kitasatospora sp. NPDC001660]
MKARHRIRAAVVALGVAASSVTIATVGATQASACGLSSLGPTKNIWAGGRTIGIYYLAWNSCSNPGQAYAEAHITNTNYTGVNGIILVKNYSGASWKSNTNPPVRVNDGTAWWDSGFLPINSYPSSERRYQGYVEFDHGDGSFWCSGYTPIWSFSGFLYSNSSDMYC